MPGGGSQNPLRGAGEGQRQIPLPAFQRRLPKSASWVSPSWLSGFFPSWRAGKRIRGIPKGREEEDSGAFQPCGLSSKQNCSHKPWPQLQKGNPIFLRLSHYFSKRKKGEKSCSSLGSECRLCPADPVLGKACRQLPSSPLLLLPANPMGQASGANTV